MAKRGKRTTTKTPQRGGPGVKSRFRGRKASARKRSAADFVKRRTEVDAKGSRGVPDLSGREEGSRRAQGQGRAAAAPPKSRGMSRRTMFNVAVGTAAVAEAGGARLQRAGQRLGVGPRRAPRRRQLHRGAAPQHRSRGRRQPGRRPGPEPRQLGRPAADQAGRRHLCASTSTPTACWPRSGTGTTATTIRSATISAPSRAPIRMHGFEFVNTTQGGQNSLIYGMPTAVTAETAPPGTNIYRVRFDGTQMQLIENVSETTGLGLGVHVTVNPKDAQSYFVTDGQKDIAACFDRTTSKVKAALRFDWTPNVRRAARRLDQGRHAHHQEDLSRSEDRPVRLPRHQGQQDRLGNGADGRAVRRGRLDCPATARSR